MQGEKAVMSCSGLVGVSAGKPVGVRAGYLVGVRVR